MLGVTASLSSPDSALAATEADRRYLSGHLMDPWRARFPNKTQLRWIGDGPLQKLPLSALPDGEGEPLVASLSVTYLDGPACHTIRLDPNSQTLLVGGASDLTGATAELETLRRLFPRGESWKLGGGLETLKAMVPRHRLLHISTHGAAPSSADLGGRLLGDGQQLTSFELAGLTFTDSSMAVLGSCQSYIDAGTGHDNSSLVSALRTAGADVVVGSLWELDDTVTAQLFQEFYEGLRDGATAERALTEAQLVVRRQKAHPYYWAGLQVVSGP
jgi:CHAT domain-containing protein